MIPKKIPMMNNQMNITEIQKQIQQYVNQLSPERLQVAVDFLAYLVERESNEAIEELSKISECNSDEEFSEESFRRSWQQAMIGDTVPLSQLWEDTDIA